MKLPLIAALFLAAFGALNARADNAPSYQNVLSAVTSDFNSDGGFDRAVLVGDGDIGADLYLYLSKFDDNTKQYSNELALEVKGVAYNGFAWGQQPSLSMKGSSLVIHSENSGIGRDRWSKDVTVAYRDGAFVVAGLTYSEYDTLDPNHNGSCDLNYLSGTAKINNKSVKFEKTKLPLSSYSDDNLPKLCQFN